MKTNPVNKLECMVSARRFSLALVLLVLFAPLRIAFGLAALPLKMYLIAFGVSFIPLLVMEISKKFGLIKHQH